MVLDNEYPATPYDAGSPAGAPTSQDVVDPVIPDAITVARSGDSDPFFQSADAPKCDGDLVMPVAGAPMISRACAPRVPGNLFRERGLGV